MPPPRALNILTHSRQLDLPVKRTSTGIRLGTRRLSVRDVTVFYFYRGVVSLASPPPDQREPYIHEICNQITETKSQ